MSRQEFWPTVVVFAPLVGFALSVLVSLLYRVVAGRVVRVSRAWVVVAVSYGLWIFCAVGPANAALRPYTGVGGEAWAQILAYLLIVGLFLGFPVVLFATIYAIGSQVVHIAAAMRGAQAAPDAPGSMESSSRQS